MYCLRYPTRAVSSWVKEYAGIAWRTNASDKPMKISLKRQQELIRTCVQKGMEAATRGDSPFGAILVDYRGEIAAISNNTTFTDRNTTSTCEINIIRYMSKEYGARDLSTFSLFTN